MYIYRNHTVEHLFKKFNATYSGYGDISKTPNILKDELIIWFYELTWNSSFNELLNEIEDFELKISLLFENYSEDKSVVIFFPDTSFLKTNILSDTKLERSLINLKNTIISLSDSNSRIKFLDLNYFTRNYSKKELIDWKFYYVSDMIINPKLGSDFSLWFTNRINSIKSLRKKCLVLDCDNTLWGGVVSEDGLSGIKIGNTYPGNVFRDFQSSIIELHNQGVILALCSKNNFDDVKEVFDDHPNMLLKMNHITCHKINWKNKAENIYEISKELNIGLDSIVFIDDNPSERGIVKEKLKTVEVPEFPESPYLIKSFFDNVIESCFQLYKLTNEDKVKTKQYSDNKKRGDLKSNFSNIDDYLSSLNIVLEVKMADKFSIPRVSQMTQKTNQFNLTSFRYTEEDIISMIKLKSLVFVLSVQDKFGDSGITGLIILKKERDNLIIDTFLMSCRVLGRGIEIAFLKHVLNHLKEKGVKIVKGRYIVSSKNKQTENFYNDFGFLETIKHEDGTKDYSIEFKSEFEIKNFYKIN